MRKNKFHYLYWTRPTKKRIWYWRQSTKIEKKEQRKRTFGENKTNTPIQQEYCTIYCLSKRNKNRRQWIVLGKRRCKCQVLVNHNGIHNSITEYKIICNKNYDNHYGVISESNDVDNIPPSSYQEDKGKYPIRKLNDDDILNVESGTSVSCDYGDNDDTYNDTIPNQANNNRPNNGKSKTILLRSSEHLICSQIEGSIGRTNTNDTILENVRQYWRLNTLICEVNEECFLASAPRQRIFSLFSYRKYQIEGIAVTTI